MRIHHQSTIACPECGRQHEHDETSYNTDKRGHYVLWCDIFSDDPGCGHVTYYRLPGTLIHLEEEEREGEGLPTREECLPAPGSRQADEQSFAVGSSSAFEAGGKLYNMPPAKRQAVPDYGAGIDTLKLTCYGTFDEKCREHFLEELERAKLYAQEGHENLAWVELLGGLRVQVKPHGMGKGFSHAPYVIEYQGIQVGVTERQSAMNTDMDQPQPNLYIEVGSLPWLVMGQRLVLDTINQITDGLGFDAHIKKVSRVDVCADLPGTHMSEVEAMFDADCIVRRSRKSVKFQEGGYTQTLQLGTPGAPVLCRVYDKLTEVEKSPVKRASLEQLRWGGQPESAVRVEFQLRRETLLNQHSIDTLEDFFAKLRSLVTYLTGEWCRFTKSPVRSKNYDLAEDSTFWQTVKKKFFAWAGEKDQPRERREVRNVDVKGLVRQALGCLRSAAARCMSLPEVPEDFLHFIWDRITCECDDLVSTVWLRRREIESREPELPEAIRTPSPEERRAVLYAGAY